MKIIKRTIRSWLSNDPFSQSAAAAYYATFSLPGLLIIIMGIAAIFFDQRSVEREVLGHIRNMLGVDVARSVGEIVDETQRNDRDIWAMAIGGFTLLFGATGLFAQLQKSLNFIWKVEVKKNVGFLKFMKHRATAFGVVVAIGFLLMISLSINAALSALGDWLETQIPGYWLFWLYALNMAASYFIISFLFALIFKVLPDAQVKWKFSLVGGVFSATLFSIGEYGLNLYFKLAEPQSAFGAAGSVILLMLWVSYSCLILLLGAEFAKACSVEYDSKVKPNEIAKKMEEKN